jgi:hypothetical protein
MTRRIIRISFSHDTPPYFQIPYFMIVEEEYEFGEIVYATVLFQIDTLGMEDIVIEGPIKISKSYGRR